jgi:hypothetical protein
MKMPSAWIGDDPDWFLDAIVASDAGNEAMLAV